MYGVKRDALALLKSYLINRTQKFQINGTISSERLIKCGVRATRLYFRAFILFIIY